MTTLTTPCGCGRPKADGTHDYPRPNTHEFVPYVAPQWIIDRDHAAALEDALGGPVPNIPCRVCGTDGGGHTASCDYQPTPSRHYRNI
jgi:hypothetical protein